MKSRIRPNAPVSASLTFSMTCQSFRFSDTRKTHLESTALCDYQKAVIANSLSTRDTSPRSTVILASPQSGSGTGINSNPYLISKMSLDLTTMSVPLLSFSKSSFSKSRGNHDLYSVVVLSTRQPLRCYAVAFYPLHPKMIPTVP